MDFIDMTKKGLSIPQDKENLIAERGFDVYDYKKENAILIMGLNPAGNDIDAKRERTTKRTYLFSIDTLKIKSNWIYNNYFKPIYNFADSIYQNDVKWSWCNKDESCLEAEVKKSDPSLWDDIKSWYEKDSKHKHTIYIGDMFYFHSTNSKELPISPDCDYNKYCWKMLNLHISKLKKHNKTIDFIYINNAQVSHWLCNKDEKSFEKFNEVPVFYGPMLSGMHAIDCFSRIRLINEIKAII